MREARKGFAAATAAFTVMGAVPALFQAVARSRLDAGHRAPHRLVMPVRSRFHRAARRACRGSRGAFEPACRFALGAGRDAHQRQLAGLRLGRDERPRRRCKPGLFHQSPGERAPRGRAPGGASEPCAVGCGGARLRGRCLLDVRHAGIRPGSRSPSPFPLQAMASSARWCRSRRCRDSPPRHCCSCP